MKKVEVIAHRGASAISPENTMAAFKKAISAGADAVETDVQMTKDKQLVLIHDETLERTTNGHGLVKNHTLAELKKLDAGSWFSDEYKGETIPTIDELFKLVKEEDIWANVEIKKRYSVNIEVDRMLIQKIAEYGIQDKVLVSCFNPYSIFKVKKINPSLKTGALYSRNIYRPWSYAKMLKANSIHPKKELVSKYVVDNAHRNNLKVFPYTVDDKEEMIKLINMDVDGLITNVPGDLRVLLNELNS